MAIRLAVKYRRRYVARQVIQAGGLERARVLLARYEASGELPLGLIALLPEWNPQETHDFLVRLVNELEEEGFQME